MPRNKSGGLMRRAAGVRVHKTTRLRMCVRNIFLGGHPYGGRQATMLAAEQPQLVQGLLLLSYPLHPPRKPEAPRTAHFPKLATPALFVHGSRDPFASLDEMKAALKLIPGQPALLEVEGAAHELLPKKSINDLPARIIM